MKTTGYGLLLAMLASLGCLNHPTLTSAKKEPQLTTGGAATFAAFQGLNPVTPDQVTEGNAHAKSQALWDEMDGDSRGDVQPAAAKSSCPPGKH